MDKEQKKLMKKIGKTLQEIDEILNNVEKISKSQKYKMERFLLDVLAISVKIKKKINIIKYIVMIEQKVAKLDTKTNTPKENNNKILIYISILEYKICLLKELLLRLYQHLQDQEEGR